MLKRIPYFVGLVLTSALLTELLLYSQNNLLQNNRWIVTKKMLKMAVMGSDEFLLNREVLAKNQLNLSKFNGYQEVYTKKVLKPKQIEFNYKISNGSFLDFFVRDKQGSQSGFRLSSSSTNNSFAFVRNHEGKFLRKQLFEQMPRTGAWNSAKVNLNDSEITLQLNKAMSFNFKFDHPLAGNIGFRAGANGAIVDDIFIRGKSALTFLESFRRTDRWFKVWVIHFIVILILIELAHLLLRFNWKAKNESKSIDIRNFITYQLVSCLFILFLFDYYYWSSKPFSPQSKILFTNTMILTNKLERARFALFRKWAELFELNQNQRQLISKNGYPVHRTWRGPILCTSNSNRCSDNSSGEVLANHQQCRRLLFLGSSQTVGSGASSLSKTFFVRIHKSLVQNFKPMCLVSLNMSISGAVLSEITNEYKTNFLNFKPQIMVINISNNDSVKSIQNDLPTLLELNQKLGTQSVLVEEANSFASNIGKDHLFNNHKAMRSIAVKYSVPTLKLNSTLQEKETQEVGVLWWDHVHLTDFGHKIAADWLSKNIILLWD